MSSLSIPTHVAARIKAEKQLARPPVPPMVNPLKHFQPAGADVAQDADMPIPEGLPDPGLWRLILMPIRQRVKTKGKILLADETLDTQNWTHALWKVCKVGPFVYRGPAYQGFSPEELEANRPKVGELYLVDPKAPRRFNYKKVLFIVVNDDQLWGRVEPENIDGLEFKGLEL